MFAKLRDFGEALTLMASEAYPEFTDVFVRCDYIPLPEKYIISVIVLFKSKPFGGCFEMDDEDIDKINLSSIRFKYLSRISISLDSFAAMLEHVVKE